MADSFTPKQIIEFDGGMLTELQGNVSESIARDILTLIPPITSVSTIHDNGCGYGGATSEIIASSPPPGFNITATDINPTWLSQLTHNAEKGGWPVTTTVMDSCKLTFANESFDLSITDFVFMGLKEPIVAAEHIKRTLKIGGTAVVSVWDDIPWRDALLSAHTKTRGAEAPIPPFMVHDLRGAGLKSILQDAGWEDVVYVEKAAWLKTRDLRRWMTLAWSFLCTPVGGWTKEDEERWDEAIEEAVTKLSKLAEKGSYVKSDGEHRIRMAAVIAVMQKEG